MQSFATTTIVPSFPGYIQCQGVVVDWMPVPRIYSPPLLHVGVRLRTMDISHLSPGLVALLIGGHGYYFKKFTKWSGALYLFVRGTTIEVWGFGDSVERALYFLNQRIQSLVVHNALRVQQGPAAPWQAQQQQQGMAPAF